MDNTPTSRYKNLDGDMAGRGSVSHHVSSVSEKYVVASRVDFTFGWHVPINFCSPKGEPEL